MLRQRCIPVRYYRQPPYSRLWLDDASHFWRSLSRLGAAAKRVGTVGDRGFPRLAPYGTTSDIIRADHYPYSVQNNSVRSVPRMTVIGHATPRGYLQPRASRTSHVGRDPAPLKTAAPTEPQSRQDPQRQPEQPRYQPEPKGGLRGRSHKTWFKRAEMPGYRLEEKKRGT
jgi:hypothetical protein